jgi:heme-degrading monooxygenase HmoA
MLNSLATQLPYYAVIFISLRTEGDHGYAAMAKQMEDLARQHEGFLGIHHARETIGITVSYWKTAEHVRAWKQHSEHLLAQTLGRSDWYSDYLVKVCRVEREYARSDAQL